MMEVNLHRFVIRIGLRQGQVNVANGVQGGDDSDSWGELQAWDRV